MKFFKKELKEGGTIHTPGFAAGIMKMARALEMLSVDGGYVSWTADGMPKIVINQSASSIFVFEVVSEAEDWLMCARVKYLDSTQKVIPVDAETPEKLYKVWKPWMLRQTPFDGKTRDGIDYAYGTTGIRVATPTGGDPEDSETQYITPSYSVRVDGTCGELIHATAGISRIVSGSTPVKMAGEFMDMNTAGRSWAVGEEVA